MRKKFTELSLSLAHKGESLPLQSVLETYFARLGYEDQTQGIKIKLFLEKTLPPSLFSGIQSVKKNGTTLTIRVQSAVQRSEIKMLTELLKKRIYDDLQITIDKIFLA